MPMARSEPNGSEDLVPIAKPRSANARKREMRMTHPTLTSITHTLRVPVHPVAVVDVCGCGDTAMAGIAASLLNSSDPFTAVQFANAAAATVITQKRTAVADLSQTLKLLGRTEV